MLTVGVHSQPNAVSKAALEATSPIPGADVAE